jgi:hypothetical protein
MIVYKDKGHEVFKGGELDDEYPEEAVDDNTGMDELMYMEEPTPTLPSFGSGPRSAGNP